eukprot:g8010.t2
MFKERFIAHWIEQGEVDWRDPPPSRRATALMYAASAGHADIAMALLRAQASPLLVDELQRSPADLAREVGATQLARQLERVAETWPRQDVKLEPAPWQKPSDWAEAKPEVDGDVKQSVGMRAAVRSAQALQAHAPKGKKKLIVLRATDLVTSIFSLSVDPFVKVRIGQEVQETAYAASANPVWDEQFSFFVQGTEVIIFSVWAREDHDFIARAELPLKHHVKELYRGQRLELDLELGNQLDDSASLIFAMPAFDAQAVQKTKMKAVMAQALQKAWRSGSMGFLAGTSQVLVFMWLRTAMNYQYKFGGSLREVLQKLWAEGGLLRLYQGLFWAILQVPLSRFGDVAANDLSLAVARVWVLPLSMTTFLGSISGAAWRILITPVETCKTILQTDGSQILRKKLMRGGLFGLWEGWEGNYLANLLGSYPCFVAMNLLQHHLPVPRGRLQVLGRSALIGAIGTSASDVVANFMCIIKTKKQTSSEDCSYWRAAQQIIEKDGVGGVFFRGLGTRILINILQGSFFNVLHKYLSSID